MLVLHKISKAPEPSRFKPSIYNLVADTPDGDIIVVNTLSGSRVVFPRTFRDQAAKLLSGDETEVTESNGDLIRQLNSIGLLVPQDNNEGRKLRYLHAHQTSSMKHLHLIVFPTEKCNFRCIYCYEDFVKGKMSPAMRSALKTYLLLQIKSLRSLNIDWFGGEPLLAFDVIRDVLPEIREACNSAECKLSGHITTNGYLLTPDVASELLDWNVESFQITLDGPRDEHDKRRQLHKSAHATASNIPENGTYDKILENVKHLLSQRRVFDLLLRTNYDLDSLPVMDSWLDTLVDLVGQDPRVRVDFCPIWADPCKVAVSIPIGEQKQRTYTELLVAAHARGLRTNAPDCLSLGGLVCYAAKANSLVIRSDGTINKCTVALDTDYNQVGRLHEDGSLELDLDKFAKWTSSGLEEDSTLSSVCTLSLVSRKRVSLGALRKPSPALPTSKIFPRRYREHGCSNQ